MLMAGIDGIRKQLNAVDLGLGPHNRDLYTMPEETKAHLETTPINLEDALKCLEADHEYLLAGEAFSADQISNWIHTKRLEARDVRNRPHPYEFPLYFDL